MKDRKDRVLSLEKTLRKVTLCFRWRELCHLVISLNAEDKTPVRRPPANTRCPISCLPSMASHDTARTTASYNRVCKIYLPLYVLCFINSVLSWPLFCTFLKRHLRKLTLIIIHLSNLFYQLRFPLPENARHEFSCSSRTCRHTQTYEVDKSMFSLSSNLSWEESCYVILNHDALPGTVILQSDARQTNICKVVGFEVLTAVSTKMAVFWVVAPCSLVEVYQRFRGPCCLHHQLGLLIALMMEAARTSETLVNFYQITRRYNPEDNHLQL
jgi:hypothetical protein